MKNIFIFVLSGCILSAQEKAPAPPTPDQSKPFVVKIDQADVDSLKAFWYAQREVEDSRVAFEKSLQEKYACDKVVKDGFSFVCLARPRAAAPKPAPPATDPKK